MNLRRIIRLSWIFLLLLTSAFFILKSPDKPLAELKSIYCNEASKFIVIDGIDVHYRQEGSGPHLLLIHGTASSLHTWDGWVKELQNEFTITRLDIPAFGLTGPHPSGAYTSDFYVNFINEFVQKMKLNKFHLAGNSLGGGIAWSYAVAHPKKVDKLILIDASGYPKVQVPTVFKIARNPFSAFLLKNITPRSFIAKNLKEVYLDDQKVTEELVTRYHDLTLREGNRQAFVDRARIALRYPYEYINQVNVPTLIQWGEFDEWISLEDAKRFHEEIPDSQLFTYKAGHVPMEEIPLTTARDAREFLVQ